MKRSTKAAVQTARRHRSPKPSPKRVAALERLRDEVAAAQEQGTFYARESRIVAILTELEKL
jgi:hypothetical protein